MIKRLENLKISIFAGEGELLKRVQKKAGAPLKYFKILKKSLDARDKNDLFWVYSVAYSTSTEREPVAVYGKIKGNPKIAVIGSGPAGLFCALRLIDHGFKPIIIERGEAVEKRRLSCERFFSTRKLDTNSNVQFGEGGAGAFSDGKLNTRTKDGYNADVLQTFHRFGANEDILYSNKPHVGSDVLYTVLRNMRAHIEENGGVYMFDTLFYGFEKKDGRIKTLRLKNVKSGEESELTVDAAVLAIGHSARDTFKALYEHGVAAEAKDFAVGVRIEHLAAEIGYAQYGKHYAALPAADYRLVSHKHERAVFTFCMCPGGVVIPAASENGGVVVNGMSLRARDGKNSNSALMVQMRATDFGGGLFAGVEFQRGIEQKAFEYGGGDYSAPVQLYGDFAKDRVSDKLGSIAPTYEAGTAFAPLAEILPPVATEALKAAIPDMGCKLKGFDCADAVLSGVETRFSSPVKFLRGENLQSVTIKGLYPCGEGCGYSGGITSSAADGIKIAEKIYSEYAN